MSAGPTSDTRYATTVVQVGSQVSDLLAQGMLVLFGKDAPAELHDISVLHEPEVTGGGLRVGDRVVLDDQEFEVLAVGDVAEANLVNLGHVDLKFNGETAPPMPGDVCLPAVPAPLPAPGSTVSIVGVGKEQS